MFELKMIAPVFLVCSSINGIPACVNKFLLIDVLRNEWGFTGYVISDWHAITDVIATHKYCTIRFISRNTGLCKVINLLK